MSEHQRGVNQMASRFFVYKRRKTVQHKKMIGENDNNDNPFGAFATGNSSKEDELINYFDTTPEPPASDKSWMKSEKFLAIKGITTREIATFSGQVEKGTPLKTNFSAQGGRINSSTVVKSTAPTYLVGFGKYAAKEISWVKEHDNGYFTWAIQNVGKFAKMVEKLKL